MIQSTKSGDRSEEEGGSSRGFGSSISSIRYRNPSSSQPAIQEVDSLEGPDEGETGDYQLYIDIPESSEDSQRAASSRKVLSPSTSSLSFSVRKVKREGDARGRPCAASPSRTSDAGNVSPDYHPVADPFGMRRAKPVQRSLRANDKERFQIEIGRDPDHVVSSVAAEPQAAVIEETAPSSVPVNAAVTVEEDVESLSPLSTKQIVELVVLFAIWYGSSMLCNTISKILLLDLGSSTLLTTIQMGISCVASMVVCGYYRGNPFPYSTNNDLEQWALAKVAVCFTLGFACVNAGFKVMNVSLAETLRAGEPLFSLVLTKLIVREEPITRERALSVLVIVSGISLASYGSGELSLLGFALAMCSNLLFALRSVFAKRARNDYDIDALDMFAHVVWIGLLVQILLCVFIDFGKLWDYQFLAGIDLHWGMVVVNGLCFFTYNQVSLIVLSKVNVVTHAIGNGFRRVAVIAFAVAVFANPITLMNLLGMSCAVVGVMLYGIYNDRSRQMSCLHGKIGGYSRLPATEPQEGENQSGEAPTVANVQQ